VTVADDLTTWTLTAETKEWVGPIAVTADGTPVTSFEVSVTAGGARPSTWEAALLLNGGRGVMVGVGTTFPLRVGQRYTVWARFTDITEVPVLKVGAVRVT
jgi:hypothetical protein